VKVRVQFKPLAKTDHNAVLEDELREVAADFSAKKRLEMSETLARWADQLFESAMQINPKIVKPLPAPKVPRGFFLVNLAQWQQDDLREIGKQCSNGSSLQSLISWGITKVKVDLRERLKFAKLMGVKPQECWRFIDGRAEN
jgi:hypothetical protein